jgi:hypothetical protein
LSPDQILLEAGSFRDENGFIFYKGNTVYRKISPSYKIHYDQLQSSGLYKKLVMLGLLVSHEEVDPGEFPEITDFYKIIKPRIIPFISYPYEWCFEQLKEAGLVTLHIQKIALEHGMSLKDASAYNVQFLGAQPVFIDSLSFEIYREGEPWKAYRQFCQHFLAVLALMRYRENRLSLLLKSYLDGIPLDLTAKLLPRRTKWKFSLLTHIHLQSRSIKRYGSQQNTKAVHSIQISKNSMLSLINHLESSVRKITPRKENTQWSDYYTINNYTPQGLNHKEKIIKDFAGSQSVELAWDVGANDGRFSKILSNMGIYTVAADLDHEAVQYNFLSSKKESLTNLLPILLDLTNPSPFLGWQNKERKQWNYRRKPGLIMALALMHHLAFSHNISFSSMASYFSSLCQFLIIEFIPAEDSQVALLPKPNLQIAREYTQQQFESTFSEYFIQEKKEKIEDSARVIYLFRSK